jgi:hypothetical protein
MSSITAGTSSGSALVSAGDTTGDLILNVNGATASVSLKANGSIGVGATPSYGTAGQVLLSNGSGSAPSWGGATVTLVSSTLVSSSTASVAFTGLSNSTYSYYIFEWSNTYGTSNGALLTLTLSADNGSTYYGSVHNYLAVSCGSGISQVFGTSTPSIVLAGNAQGVGTTSSAPTAGVLEIHNANVAGGTLTYRSGSMSDAGNQSFFTGSGSLITGTSTFNAFRVQLNSGNIANGRFYLYGVKNS